MNPVSNSMNKQISKNLINRATTLDKLLTVIRNNY